MDKKKILWLSDFDPNGSGYRNVSVKLCEGLANLGHEVKCLALMYAGEEHWFNFSLIPCPNLQMSWAMINNFKQIWGFDCLVVALDLPVQGRILSLDNVSNRDFPYLGITAVEADPLIRPWADLLKSMEHSFIISEFGVQEAIKMGVSQDQVSHIPIGIDREAFRPPTKEERYQLRMSYGIAEDEFVILTVADNQERKNLSRSMQIVSKFKEETKAPFRYIMVTRQQSAVGWRLNTLAEDMNLIYEFMPFERGLPFKEFWSLFAIADCFLLTSKAEGLGIPALEAMSVGIPVVATDCTGLRETMFKGGGFPIRPERLEADFIDPFGNAKRYLASVSDGVRQLKNVWKKQGTDVQVSKGMAYVDTLKWANAVNVLDIHVQKAVVSSQPHVTIKGLQPTLPSANAHTSMVI